MEIRGKKSNDKVHDEVVAKVIYLIIFMSDFELELL